jgi:nucleoside-diphosphate-sugar epimerase
VQSEMRIVVIGGTGHVGTFLVPKLVTAGHEVVVITRGQRQPYQPHPAWDAVQRVEIVREEAEREGTFGQRVRALHPDVVMDLVCFRVEQAQPLVEALRGEVQHFLHCGTIWVHGYNTRVPMTEDEPRVPIDEYGVGKVAVERYLLDQARRTGFPATALHPGHIVGPGWAPLGPSACHDLRAFEKLARGDEFALPHLGLETMHHVHADDVAQAFCKAMTHWSSAVGESFFVVSPAALTLRSYAETVAGWFGKPAKLRFLPLEEWKQTLTAEWVDAGVSHLEHCSNCSCEKARRLIGYEPRYTSLEAIRESVNWLIQHGQVHV